MANTVTTRTTRLMMIAGSTFITALLVAQVASADRLPDKDISSCSNGSTTNAIA